MKIPKFVCGITNYSIRKIDELMLDIISKKFYLQRKTILTIKCKFSFTSVRASLSVFRQTIRSFKYFLKWSRLTTVLRIQGKVIIVCNCREKINFNACEPKF